MNRSEPITIVGAGLGGALLAGLLGRSGHQVEVYEMRPDPRVRQAGGGRSINLAISKRGLHALNRVGLADEIREMAITMRGRMIHSISGRRSLQRYGTLPDQVLNSVSRESLNIALLNRAGSAPGVRLHFGKKCTGMDFERGRLTFIDVATGRETQVEAGTIVGADGAFSTIRQRMERMNLFDHEQSYLTHGYKELTIPPATDGSFAMDRNALHIWPRGGFMMIALPNRDGSFTCTLFWPLEGPARLKGLGTGTQVVQLFKEVFPDAFPLMPDLTREFFANPTGSLVTIRCRPWHWEGRGVLLGDACHAVVPFFGQGANAAFEDCGYLLECLERHPADRSAAFREYQSLRKENTDTLAALSIENFREMRDRTRSRLFRLQKAAERGLQRLFPTRFVTLYNLVTFTRVPYTEAVNRVRKQFRRLEIGVYFFFLVISLLLLVWIIG